MLYSLKSLHSVPFAGLKIAAYNRGSFSYYGDSNMGMVASTRCQQTYHKINKKC